MRLSSKRLLRCGLIAPPLYVAFVFAATLARGDYSSIGVTLSHLGDIEARHAWVFNTGIAVYGALVAAFAAGVYGAYRETGEVSPSLLFSPTEGEKRNSYLARGRGLAIAAPLALYGAANIAIGAFKVDVLEAGGDHGAEHAIHIAAARAAYVLAIIAMAGAAYALAGKRRLRLFSLIAVVSMVVFGILFSMESVESKIGLWQRGFIGTAVLWVEALAVAMHRAEQRERLTGLRRQA